MASTGITERQRYWCNHVLTAASHDSSIVEYAAANDRKIRDLYQCKTALTGCGFLIAERYSVPATVQSIARKVSGCLIGAYTFLAHGQQHSLRTASHTWHVFGQPH